MDLQRRLFRFDLWEKLNALAERTIKHLGADQADDGQRQHQTPAPLKPA